MKKNTSYLVAVLIMIICTAFSFNAFADDENKIDISAGEITLSSETYTYNGKEKTPKVTLNLTVVNPETQQSETKALVLDTDYTAAYSNNINAGTATVTLEGTGDYCGTLSKDYTIAPCKLTSSHMKIANTAKAYPDKAPEYSVSYD